MSLRERAQDEADRWYPTFNHIGAVQNQAFVLGTEWASQQEPSEAEVRAAARAMFDVADEQMHFPTGFDQAPEPLADTYRRMARAALLAARKAARHE